MIPKDIIRKSAQRYADNTAFICYGKSITYREVNSRSNRLADSLLKKGISRGDRVVVILPNCIEFIEVRFATYKIGAVLVPLNTRMFDTSGFIFSIKDSGAKAAIMSEPFKSSIKEFKKALPKVTFVIVTNGKGDFIRYKDFLGKDVEPNIKISEEDIATLAYSSGTTGKPKGIVTTNSNWINSCYNLFANADTAITSNGVMMHITPLTHATNVLVLPFFMKGAIQILIEDYDPRYILQTVHREKVTFTMMIPAMLLGLLKETFSPWYLAADALSFGQYLSSLKTIIYGSAPMYIIHLKYCMKRFGKRLEQAYGMAEALPPVAILGRDDHILEGDKAQERRLLSTGRVVQGVELKIVDSKGREVSPNTTGEIVVKSKTVCKGYWKLPKLTKETHKDGWFYTNDLGMLDEDGYLYIVGRRKEMIIKRGLNMFPKEIEGVLASHPEVQECCVFGIPDVRFGEEIGAAVVKKGDVTEEELKEFCSYKLNKFMVPKVIEFYDKLPKTTSGKIQRQELKEKFWDGYNRATNYK